MNTRTRTLTTLVAVIVALCLSSLEQPASAQSPNSPPWLRARGNSQSASAQSSNSSCKQAKGEWVEFYPGTGDTDFGTVTNAGILNGTAETVYGSDFFPTSDPNIVSFFADSTLTTDRGVLKTHNVYIGFIDVGGGPLAPGVFTALFRIDPVASTGIFAGATGFLNMHAKVTDFGFTVHYDITGEICFANE